MVSILTSYLHRYTMYQLVVRYLIGLHIVAIALAWGGKLGVSPKVVIFGSLLSVAACYLANRLLATLFNTQTNKESWFISSLILSLVIGPLAFPSGWLPYVVAGSAAMASKFFLRWKNHHVFNPAAFGLLVMTLVTGVGSSWWIGNWSMIIFTILGGLLIAFKVRRLWSVGLFLIVFVVGFVVLNGLALNLTTNLSLTQTLIFGSPIIFYATVMLIEPSTSPTGRPARLTYAGIVALLILLIQRLAPSIPYSFEAALLIGNLVTRVVEKRNSFPLTLVRRAKLNSEVESFFFEIAPKINFQPGQFLEWTLPHSSPDSRGTRRWFTIASSPTEPLIQLTTRFAEKSSSFKLALKQLKIGQVIQAHGLEGDFTLLADKTKALVFIAGGIGITPFRSMVKFLLDRGESRDMTLIYAVRKAEDLIFMDVFNEAKEAYGMKILPIVSEPDSKWQGLSGKLDGNMLKSNLPEIASAEVYVSGPEPMVESIAETLRGIGVPNSSINQDFFPGYLNDLAKS